MKTRFLMVILSIFVLVLSSLACSVLGNKALLEDDFSKGHGWGTGTDADSSVEYLTGSLNMFVYKDFWFVWSTPNEEDYENIHLAGPAVLERHLFFNETTEPTTGER